MSIIEEIPAFTEAQFNSPQNYRENAAKALAAYLNRCKKYIKNTNGLRVISDDVVKLALEMIVSEGKSCIRA